MKCINFDRAFERYMAEWMKENSEKYKDDMDVIEDMMPDVYLEFLKKPADFLDGSRTKKITVCRSNLIKAAGYRKNLYLAVFFYYWTGFGKHDMISA